VGNVPGVLVERDGDVGVVKYAVKVSAVRIDLLWGSADFMQVGVSTLFESEGVDKFRLGGGGDRLVTVSPANHESGFVKGIGDAVCDDIAGIPFCS
jgi:hypothetical protein